MPFSVFYDEDGDSFRDYEKGPSLLDSFSSNIAVVEKDRVDNYVIENAGAGILVDLNNNEALFAQNIFDEKYPASITKILTAYVALKYASLDELITCTSEVVDNINVPDAVLLGLKSGDTMTLDQALRLMLLSSYNDVAVAIAVHVSGSEEAFCELMNNEARLLGASSTHFTNSNGLSDDEHYTTVYDLYLIFNAAIQNPTILEIIQSKEYSTVIVDRNGNDWSVSSRNTNQYFKGNYEIPENVTVVGGKTGTTDEAGYCLMLLVRDKYSNPYISIILGDNSRDNLYQDMSKLLTDIIK